MDRGIPLCVNIAPSDHLSAENARAFGALLVTSFSEIDRLRLVQEDELLTAVACSKATSVGGARSEQGPTTDRPARKMPAGVWNRLLPVAKNSSASDQPKREGKADD